MSQHIHPLPEAGKAFYLKYKDKGKVVMLNLLKFKEKADYTGQDHLHLGKELTGQEAYQLYMKATMPFIKKAGSQVLFFGYSNEYLIGPESESWDMVLLVEHPSAEAFIAFAQDEDYLKITGHRTAALADSRLLPIESKPIG